MDDGALPRPDDPLQDDGGPSELDALRLALADAQARADRCEDAALRARAELENQKRRILRESEEQRRFALQNFVTGLLPVKDSLEKSIEAARDHGEGGVEALVEGAELTLRLCYGLLADAGIEQIDPLGQEFDPELHEAMGVVDDPESSPHTVVQVVQKGYVLNGRVIRPARVLVAGPL